MPAKRRGGKERRIDEGNMKHGLEDKGRKKREAGERWRSGRTTRRRRGRLFATSIVPQTGTGSWFCFARRRVEQQEAGGPPILTDSWCPPIAVPCFLSAPHNGSHPDAATRDPNRLTARKVCVHYRCTSPTRKTTLTPTE